MRSYYIFIFIVTLGFTSCKTQQVPLEEYTQPMITFGNQGGFAGTVTTYKILEDGRVYYKGPRAKAFMALDPMEKSMVKQLFSSFGDLGIYDMEINDPGNLTYFIDVNRPDKMTKSLKWGADIKPVDAKVKAIYRNMTQLVTKQLKSKTLDK